MDWISPTVMFIIIGDSVASLLTISSTFNSLFKFLCIFASLNLYAIGLSLGFSFRWNLPPSLGLHSQTTRLEENNNITKSVIFSFFILRESWNTFNKVMHGIITLHDPSFQRSYTFGVVWKPSFLLLKHLFESCPPKKHKSKKKLRSQKRKYYRLWCHFQRLQFGSPVVSFSFLQKKKIRNFRF